MIEPAWAEDNAEYLAEVAGNKGAYVTAEVVSTFGALVFISGAIGVMRRMRGRRMTLGQFAAGM